ncbi:transketolase family protein [Polymorphobacter fuscus]|uniref:Transketolase family protein n=1 Tax=Sandarakinorhabdus fusca TaxID=1439888 RepID=A0A7C9GVE3_9SPHN|nr:transketolase C-terminal domain-containing protein [Polymorphobacter fuscus]KAB7646263.1 transketolase family protein [Polymorphobacter fuscus]MQT17478.1 transketolase family protein [Polymorphobacter fuscus]NJC09983.1 transketolase [Polymorphobacter fuscus]
MSAAAPAAGLHDCREAYVRAIAELAAEDDRIVAVVNDSVGSSKLGAFRDRFPTRLINVGIAEQNMVGVGAGLANGGKIPFVSGAACFLTARAMEQIKVDCAYSQANVKLCGISSGVAYGELGATHHSIEDIAWLRAIDKLTIIVPSDPWETAAAIKAAAAWDGPVFLRISRMPVPDIARTAGAAFVIGRAETLRSGDDVAIVATGTLVHRAIAAAEALAAEGVSARVINMATVAPIDTDALAAAAATGAIVTAEEGLATGGLGGAVAEYCARNHPVPMQMIGFPGFLPTGSADWLMENFGLTAHGIAAAARDVIARKR